MGEVAPPSVRFERSRETCTKPGFSTLLETNGFAIVSGDVTHG